MLAFDKTNLTRSGRDNRVRLARTFLALLLLPYALAASHAATPSAKVRYQSDVAATSIEPGTTKSKPMHITIGARHFAITLSDSAASRAFAVQLPLTLRMADLNGNEKHAEIPKALPAKPTRPGTIRAGDLMLYGATTIVLFYKTFDSSYEYTRLGRVDDAEGLVSAIGSGDVRVSFVK